MYKQVQFLLIFCVGFILCVKDIPGINAKIDDAIASKKSIVLERQEERHNKRVEKIDLLLERIMQCFVSPDPLRRTIPYAYDDDFGYISAYYCYKSIYNSLDLIFDFGDVLGNFFFKWSLF